MEHPLEFFFAMDAAPGFIRAVGDMWGFDLASVSVLPALFSFFVFVYILVLLFIIWRQKTMHPPLVFLLSLGIFFMLAGEMVAIWRGAQFMMGGAVIWSSSLSALAEGVQAVGLLFVAVMFGALLGKYHGNYVRKS